MVEVIVEHILHRKVLIYRNGIEGSEVERSYFSGTYECAGLQVYVPTLLRMRHGIRGAES